MTDITELRRLHAAATQGEWVWKRTSSIDWGYVGDGGKPTTLFGERGDGAVSQDDPDGLFCAAAHNALPALLDELEAARAELARYRQAANDAPVRVGGMP